MHTEFLVRLSLEHWSLEVFLPTYFLLVHQLGYYLFLSHMGLMAEFARIYNQRESPECRRWLPLYVLSNQFVPIWDYLLLRVEEKWKRKKNISMQLFQKWLQ